MDLDLNSLFDIGMVHIDTYLVEDSHTASHLGSGDARVLATPWLIAFMERTSHQMLAAKLPSGYSSVGTLVNVRHLAPCAVGSTIEVKGEIISITGLKVSFKVTANKGNILLGDGTHERFVINEERFLKRLNC